MDTLPPAESELLNGLNNEIEGMYKKVHSLVWIPQMAQLNYDANKQQLFLLSAPGN